MKLDTNKIYIEIARKKWSIKDLCKRTNWSTARFNQMMYRGSAPPKSIGILAEVLDVSPELLIKKEITIRKKKV